MVRISFALNLLVLLVVVLGVAPLYPYLELPARLALPAALLLGVAGERHGRLLLKPWLATGLSLAFFGLYALQVSPLQLVEPVINVLALLLAVRLATAKSARNYLQIFLLALLCLAASSLVSLSIAFFFFLVPEVVAVVVGLVFLCFYTEAPALVLNRRDGRRLLATSLVLPGVSLVLMLVFFVILPRTQFPLWNLFSPRDGRLSGISESVELGSVESLTMLGIPVFRAESPILAIEERYWRVLVLNTPVGRTWQRRAPPERMVTTPQGDREIRQTLVLEPRHEQYLPILDCPVGVIGVSKAVSGDHNFTTQRRLEQRFRYATISRLGGTLPVVIETQKAFYLTLPEQISSRVREAGERIRLQAPDAESRVELAQRMFQELQLNYSTTNLPQVADPIDDFLFVNKRGYCEYFATSFVVLLRLADVPSRLVGGYFGADYNEIGGYYLVTEDRAHLWVEAQIDGRWERIDPSQLAQNAASVTAERQRGPSRLAQLFDLLNYQWNRGVVTYDLGRQFELWQQGRGGLRQLRQLRLDATPRGIGLVLLGGGLLAGLGWWLWRRGSRRVEERLRDAFLRAIARRYQLAAIPQQMGLATLAETVNDAECRAFVALYGGALYRDRPLTRGEIIELRRLLRRIQRG